MVLDNNFKTAVRGLCLASEAHGPIKSESKRSGISFSQENVSGPAQLEEPRTGEKVKDSV